MSKPAPILQLQSVSKSFSNKKIIKNLSLEIYPGSIVSLLGINGAGKSSLIKMMLGLEKPDAGLVHLYGLNPLDKKSRLRVGVILQDSDFIDELTARETLRLISLHYVAPLSIESMIESFVLGDFIDKRMHTLSQGQKRRVALALAFIGNPQLVFLDEPTVGLDVQSRLSLWKFIKAFRKPDTSIVLTTHYLEEAQALADRILILHEGNIIADGSVDFISQRFSAAKINFKLRDQAEWLSHYPEAMMFGTENYSIESNDSDNVIRELVKQDVPFKDLQISKTNLEDIFVKILEA